MKLIAALSAAVCATQAGQKSEVGTTAQGGVWLVSHARRVSLSFQSGSGIHGEGLSIVSCQAIEGAPTGKVLCSGSGTSSNGYLSKYS